VRVRVRVSEEVRLRGSEEARLRKGGATTSRS